MPETTGNTTGDLNLEQIQQDVKDQLKTDKGKELVGFLFGLVILFIVVFVFSKAWKLGQA